MAPWLVGPARRRGRQEWHVAVVVENVAAGVDTRLRKQLDDLLAAGFTVSVVTRRSPDNDRYRGRPGIRLLEYPEPPEPSGAVGFAVEYAVSFAWAALHLARLRARRRIDVLQLCQPPDVYFPLAWLLRLGGARVVVDQRDLMPELLTSRYDGRPPAALDALLRWLERRTQRAADHTVTVNDEMRRRLVEAGADRISMVRNGPMQHPAPGRTLCPSRTCASWRCSNAHSASPRLNGLASFRGFLPRALSNACPFGPGRPLIVARKGQASNKAKQ